MVCISAVNAPEGTPPKELSGALPKEEATNRLLGPRKWVSELIAMGLGVSKYLPGSTKYLNCLLLLKTGRGK